MPERDPRRLAAWVAAGLILALLAAWYFARSRPTASASPPPIATIVAAGAAPSSASPAAKGTPAIVDVSGAVKRPGVYTLTTEDRVEDALQRAGGATRRADLRLLNRAAKLEDGRQILVPAKGKTAAAVQAPATAPGSSPGGAPATAGPVNLNTATQEQLETLDGVGPATAQKILEYREQHGGFKSVDELDQVSGIGEKRLAALRDKVTV